MLHFEISTPRLLIRPYQTDDLSWVHKNILKSKHSLVRFIPWMDSLNTEEDFKNHISTMQASWEADSALYFAVWLKDQSSVLNKTCAQTVDVNLSIESSDFKIADWIGNVSLHSFNAQNQSIEMGWYMIHAYEGQGYCTEAAQAIKDFAFASLAVNKLIAKCEQENKSSQSVAQKIGLQLLHYEECLYRSHGCTAKEHIYQAVKID